MRLPAAMFWPAFFQEGDVRAPAYFSIDPCEQEAKELKARLDANHLMIGAAENPPLEMPLDIL
jgi:hypothetical protein